MRVSAIILILATATTTPVSAVSIQDAAEAVRAKSSNYDAQVRQIPQGVLNGAAQAEAARQSSDAINSPEYQQRVQAERERLQREVFDIGPALKPAPYYADTKTRKKEGPPHLAPDERVYLFISSSMPESTLRAYAQDIDRLGDPNISMVMRGFIGGMRDALPSMEFVMRIRLKDPACVGPSCPTFGTPVDFDPNLYRRFNPAVVPALVYVRGVKPVDPDVSEGSPENVPAPSSRDWSMIYGDASLGYLFGQTADAAKSPSLAALARYLEHSR